MTFDFFPFLTACRREYGRNIINEFAAFFVR